MENEELLLSEQMDLRINKSLEGKKTEAVIIPNA